MVDGDSLRLDGNSIDGPTKLRSTFTFTRRARPPSKKSLDSEGRVPLASGPAPLQLARKESKGGLRGMFSRNKVEVDPKFSPVMEDFVPRGRTRSPSLSKSSTKASRNTTQSFLRPFPLRSSPAAQAQSEYNVPQPTGSNPTQTSKQAGKTTIKTPAKSPKTPRRTDAAWDPPPLFQAYPQAIKHALLSSSTLSADSIIRLSGHRRNSSVKDGVAQSGLGPTEEQTAAAKKNEKAKSKHRRHVSGSISKAEWTQKIYVLVTSGYLLQYAGEGSFDRLPEKMMQLGRDSVAFASDVIPGKHWVLQISQAMDADGTPAPDARSLLSRLTFRGADYRRTATSLLLVLESAEDMESWITTVRREIEALGGKKYISETGKPKDLKLAQLKSQPSHRYLVPRENGRRSNPASPQILTFKAPWNRSPERNYLEPVRPSHSSHSTVAPTTERFSIATSITSDGQHHLDSLRDGSHRLSYMSSGERTLITSRGSSPFSSPTRENFAAREALELNEGLREEIKPRHVAMAINERRRSMQALANPAFEFPATTKSPRPRPHSTYNGSVATSRNHPNQPMPNFSMTHTANKRSSLARIPDNVSPPHGNVVKTPTKPKEPMVKSVRKSPPPMLQARSLSPVQDHPSPEVQIVLRTPTEIFHQKWLEARPIVVDIPPRPQTSPQHELSPVDRPQRFSSLAPLNSAALAHIDFQFPPRRSSIQAHTEPTGRISSSPVRAALPVVVTKFPEMIALPATPAKHQGPRRPASMQFISSLTPKSPNTFPLSKGSLTPISVFNSNLQSKSAASTPACTTLSKFAGEALPTPPLSSNSTSLLSPSIQRLKSYNTPKQSLANRRSMPQLVNGPPPAPPPSCALPPLPGVERLPGMVSSLDMKRSRNSVKAA